MRKTINVKLVVMTFLTTVGAVIALIAIHEIQVRKNAGALIERADRFVEQGKYADSLVLYKTFLSYRPQDVDALEKYVRAWDRWCPTNGERTGLVVAMQKVLQQKSHLHDLRYRLVMNLIGLSRERYGDAIKHLEKLEPHWENKAEIKHMLGWCRDALEKYEEAIKDFSEAISRNPAQIESYGLLAEIFQDRLQKHDQAAAVMHKMINANPENWRAYLERARFHSRRGDYQGEEADIRLAQEKGPTEVPVLLAASRLAIRQAKYAEANEVLEQGLKSHPGQLDLILMACQLRIQQGKTEDAEQILRKGLEVSPNVPELIVQLTDILIDQNKIVPQAQENLRALAKMNVPQGVIQFLDARILIQQGDFRKPIPMLEKARIDLSPRSEWLGRINALLGYCYGRVGDHARELTAFRRAVNEEPNWLLARMGLGAALLANVRVEESVQELQKVAKAADPPKHVWLILTRALMQRMLFLAPSQRDWAQTEFVMEKAKAADPENVELAILRTEMLTMRAKPDEAKTLLTEEIGRRKENPREQLELYRQLTEIYLGLQDFEGAAATLESAAKKLGGDPLELRLARARLYSYRGNDLDLAHLEKLTQPPNSYGLDERTRWHREMAEIWYRLGEWNRAEQHWLQLAQDQLDDLPSRVRLLESYVQTNRLEQAKHFVEEIQRVEGPQGTQWRYGEAMVRIQTAKGNRKKLEEVRKFVQDLDRRNKDWSRVPLLEARIDEMLGNYHGALQQYEKAFQMGEKEPQNTARLLQLLIERKRYDRANEVYRDYSERRPMTAEIARYGTEAAVATENHAMALARVRRAVPNPPRDYRDSLWLARVYERCNEFEKAETLLRQTIKKFRDLPEAWIQIISLYHHQNQKDDAQAVLQEAKDRLKGDRLDLVMAKGFEILGNLAAAQEVYERVLHDRPRDLAFLRGAIDFFSQHDESTEKLESLLWCMLEQETGAPAEYGVRARRSLAFLFAQRESPLERKRAESLLDLNSQIRGVMLADERIRWFLSGLEEANRKATLVKFTESAERQPFSPEETLLLVRLYELDRQYENASRYLVPLTRQYPQDARYLAAYVRILAKSDDQVSRAREALVKLEVIQPKAVRTATLRQLVDESEKRARSRALEKEKKSPTRKA